jgi:hypothetical protein
MIDTGTDFKTKLQNRAHRVSSPPFRAIPGSGAYRLKSAELTRVTRDLHEIRRWVECRQGRPAARVPLLFSQFRQEEIGILQIAFPDDPKRETLKEISWETFFEVFTARRLAFLYQERTETGEQSRFNKFIKQERAPQPERLQIAA